MGALDEHIKQSEIYMKYKAVYREYRQIQKPKKREVFYEENRMELTLFEAAKRYLEAHMNGKTTLPIKAWKAEREKLNAEKAGLYREYRALKDDVWQTEIIKRTAERILRDDGQERKPERARGTER